MADDLSDLLDDDYVEVLEEDTEGDTGADRIFVGGEEYIRADAIRAGFTRAIWREAARYANRTAGQPGGALRRVRDLIEEGR